MTMTALILNMASATERMRFMGAQMAHHGLPFERIEAITPATLSPPPEDPVWNRWQRPLRVTEMAGCASHKVAWRRIRALGRPCLVLEDDAVLASDLAAFLAQVAGMQGVDHISLETRARKKLVSRHAHREAPMRRLYQDRTGAAAMVIWPSGAEKLLRHAERCGALADALISSTYDLRSFQADPALSVQLDMAERYGVPRAIATSSQIDAEAKPPVAQVQPALRRAFLRRRLAAQLQMAARHLRFMPVAQRRYVEPARHWPDIEI